MKLRDWRKVNNLSQAEMIRRLQEFATKEFSMTKSKKLNQQTFSWWENGVFPRKFWLNVIMHFTKNEVTASDFCISDEPKR